MKGVSENELKRVVNHCQRFSRSLQYVLHERTGNFYHDNSKKPLSFIYLCPICLKNKAAILREDDFRGEEEFTIDHFPPESAGGRGKILVCKQCNNEAGKEYDYALKKWLQEQAFVKGIPNSRVPVGIEFEGLSGKYKESLVSEGAPLSFNFDRFTRYPKVKEWFNEMLAGKPMDITLKMPSVPLDLVYRSILKAAYLKAFSIWGYDFIYTDTGIKLRDVFTKKAPHVLSNCGIFFHMDKTVPPEGLCYVFRPSALQSFLINMNLKDKETGFGCSVSVVIPGPHYDDWFGLKSYQPIIDAQGSFTNGLIQLPENTLTESNHFPYTETWHARHQFRIAGIHDQ